jgi:sulfur carrier protein ThiS
VLIRVKLSRTDKIKEIKVKPGLTVEYILKKINFKPDTVVVLNNNKPVPIDDKLYKDCELMIIQVSSGG